MILALHCPRRLRAWLLSLGLATLAACSPVGPDYQPPQTETPAHWGEATSAVKGGQSAAVRQWWSLFNDPLLNSLMDRAFTANLDLHIAETRIREARGQRRSAAAAGRPAVDLGGGYANSGRSKNVSSGGTRQELFEADFDASWEIDVFGGVRRQTEAAEATLAATVEDWRDAGVSLTAEVARNYLELRASQQRLAIALENSRTQEQTLDLVRNKLQIGLGDELEAAQAETLLAQTRAQAPALESSAVQATHQLALLLGRQPQTLTAELSQPGTIPPTPPQLPVILPSELLRQRPDVRSAERQLAAATATVGASTAELFPRFSLAALIGLQSVSLHDLVARSSRYWSVGPTVQWSLFDGGKARAGVEISEARRERARATYEKTVLTALGETESALVALDRERVTQKILAEAAAASQRAVMIARGQYKAGITTFLNVLQSENALYQNQDKLAQSEQRLALDMVALYKALGGGWQDVPTPGATAAAAAPDHSSDHAPLPRNTP
jgi:NodT family efflux transporter outer membrane factor (OMF) lipoprotein